MQGQGTGRLRERGQGAVPQLLLHGDKSEFGLHLLREVLSIFTMLFIWSSAPGGGGSCTSPINP